MKIGDRVKYWGGCSEWYGQSCTIVKTSIISSCFVIKFGDGETWTCNKSYLSALYQNIIDCGCKGAVACLQHRDMEYRGGYV